jgi:ubiquinone/menaquinone biosynthesis C-methylase UbiE
MNGIIKKYSGALKERLQNRYYFFRPNPKDYSTTNNLTVIPVQREAYFLALSKFVKFGDEILDVGFGLGYGITILSIKAGTIKGIDVDGKCVEYCRNSLLGRNPKLISLDCYDGKKIPFEDNTFDLVTCIDVLEHVEDYDSFILELIRVTRRGVFISTPNRRPEHTNKDGTPKNYWHLREWNFLELEEILSKHGMVDWNFINGQWDGPFTISDTVQSETQALVPFIKKM